MEVFNVYLSDNIIDESVAKLLRSARNKSLPVGYYAIVVSKKDEELLVIYNYSDVNSDRFVKEDYKIVGFGKGKYDTKQLLKYIIEDIYTNTGSICKDNFMTIRDR